MIRLENLYFGYSLGKNIISGLDLSIQDGARIRLCGPSGGGKTTVLRLIMGLERPRRGVVSVPEGTAFSAVFQEDRLIPHLSIENNVALFSDPASARSMLCRLGLEEVMNAYPRELSGGMKRRAALARALCRESDVLILDEPFNGLDKATKDICISAVNEYSAGKILILVTHDPSEAEALGASDVDLVRVV